jgi:hypothetical protein
VKSSLRNLPRFPQHRAEDWQDRIVTPPEIQLHNALASKNHGSAQFRI